VRWCGGTRGRATSKKETVRGTPAARTRHVRRGGKISYEGFAKLDRQNNKGDWFKANAAIEAFWTHARTLREFFTAGRAADEMLGLFLQLIAEPLSHIISRARSRSRADGIYSPLLSLNPFASHQWQ
jgi:hypothetical protein